MRLMGRARGRERGQVLLFTALILPAVLGMTALAVDVGSYAGDKSNLQHAADAIALAAARDLCTPNPADCSNTAAATTTANAYAVSNNIDSTLITVQFLGGNAAPEARVTIARTHSFAFAQVFGVKSKLVTVVAGAAKVSPGGISGLMPWGITQDTVDAATPGQLVTIKAGGGGGTTGNYGGMAYDGRGGSVYGDTILHGAIGTICAQSAVNCTPTGSECGANGGLSYDQCYTEPGNKVGPTSNVDTRFANTIAGCDTFAGAFTQVTSMSSSGATYGGYGGRLFSPPLAPDAKQPTSTPTPMPTNTPTPAATNTPGPTNTPLGSPTPIYTPTPAPTATPAGGTISYGLNPNCNPWNGPGACPLPAPGDPGTTICSRRVVVIPIIDSLPNGRKGVTILGFALFFLESRSQGDVSGRFVRADVNMGAIAGAYNPNSTLNYVKLVE
jgi:Flp pilus assembly protein TadG